MSGRRKLMNLLTVRYSAAVRVGDVERALAIEELRARLLGLV